jgi:hypothetical protein
MLATDAGLVLTEELRKYIPTKVDGCQHELEELLLSDGRALSPLVCWKKESGERVLIDGYRRFPICEKHGLEFDLIELAFPDIHAAKHWMDCNQFTRRNLDPAQRAILIGRMDKYLEAEKAAGRFKGSVNRTIAKQNGVSVRAVTRAKQHSCAIEKVAEPLRSQILEGDVKVSEKTLKALSELPERQQLEAAAQVEAGEYESINHAITGETEFEPLSDVTKPKATKPDKPRDNKRKPKPAVEDVGQEDSGEIVSLPKQLTSPEALAAAIKALGMLGKALDTLHEVSPNGGRLSNCSSHIAGIRNMLQSWCKEAA